MSNFVVIKSFMYLQFTYFQNQKVGFVSRSYKGQSQDNWVGDILCIRIRSINPHEATFPCNTYDWAILDFNWPY